MLVGSQKKEEQEREKKRALTTIDGLRSRCSCLSLSPLSRLSLSASSTQSPPLTRRFSLLLSLSLYKPKNKKTKKQSGEGWAPPPAANGGDAAPASTSSAPSPPAALALAAGSSSDELRYRKTTAMHLWLFTYELPGELFFDFEKEKKRSV